MRNWKTWAVAAGTIVAIVFLVPMAVEPLADRAARSRAQALSVDVEWREVEWFWTDTVRFTGVRTEHGLVKEAEIDRLDVNLALLSLVSGNPDIQGVSASGVRAAVAEPTDASGEPGTATADDESSGPLRQLVEGLRHVRLEAADIDMHRGGGTVANWSGDVVLSSAGSLSGEGALRLGQGDGASAVAWRLSGEADPSTPRASGEVVLGPPGDGGAESGKRGELRSPPLRAAADAVEFRVGAALDDGLASLEFREFTASVGDDEPAGLEFSGPAVTLRLTSERRFHLLGSSPRIELAPDRLLQILRTDVIRPSSGSDSGSGAPTGLRERLREYVLTHVDLSLTETTFELSVEGKDGWRSYRPAEKLTIRKRRRRVAAAGSFAEGWAAGRATFEPGRRLPAEASFQLSGVQLDEIPVVRTERSLPNRGVRGEIGGTVDATGTLVRTGLRGTLREQVTGTVDVEWHDGSIRADGLADEPLRNIDLSLDLTLEWEPQLGRVRLRDSTFHFGPIDVALDGSVVDWGLAPHISFEARTDEISCQRAVRALPNTLLGPYRDVAIDGRTAPHFSFDLPLDQPDELSIELDGFPGSCRPTALNTHKPGWPDVEFVRRAGAEAAAPTAANSSLRQWAAAPDPAHPIEAPADLAPLPSSWTPNRPDDVFWLRKPFVMQVTEGVSEGADVRVGPGLPSYVPLQSLPKHAAGAAYLSEEINFYSDGAWNLRLIQKGLRLDFEEERFVYGGSTVTQQLVKNLFLTRRKTLDRKIQEALIAWRMQDVVSKDRVLELYLNCIEYGEDVYGIGPAARHYFQKHASELTPLEGVFLAVIKPAPWFGDKFREEGSTPTSGWWHDRITEIMKRLVQKGFITEKRAEEAKPYVLKWDESGNYLPDAPETSGDEEFVEGEQESRDSGTSE